MFVTCVQEFGPFLKIYGQLKKEEVISVEKAIISLLPAIRSRGPPKIHEINVGQLCLGLFDEHFYRGRIKKIENDNCVILNFIDFGNVEKVALEDVSLNLFFHLIFY